MSILDVVKAVGDYGLSLILSAIVIYVLIRVIKIQIDKWQTASSRKQHDRALELRAEIDEKVYSILNGFIENHSGARLQVVEFTNTVTSVAYLPFKYMSCTYEVVSYGQTPKARYIDKISTSLCTSFLSQLGKNDSILLDHESIDLMSGVVKDMFIEIGNDKMLSVMLKSTNSKCIGYVAFFKDKTVETKDIDDLLRVGEKLSALLGVLDK